MKLCSFNVGEINRIGVLMSNGQVADCNYAYAAYQKAKGAPRAQQLADVVVPSEMVPMIECGEHGKAELRLAMEYVEQHLDATGPCGERILYNCEDIHFRAPVPNPEKIFSMAINNKFEFERCISLRGPLIPCTSANITPACAALMTTLKSPISASWAPRSKWYLSLARAVRMSLSPRPVTTSMASRCITTSRPLRCG